MILSSKPEKVYKIKLFYLQNLHISYFFSTFVRFLSHSQLVAMKEDQHTEFKRIWQDDNLKSICAFANSQGGVMYIGIDDDGQVVGLEHIHKWQEDIPNKIVQNLGIICEVITQEEFGKAYLEIQVIPSNVPISYKGVYYVRSGATKQELKGSALQQFLLTKIGKSWDDMVCDGATIEDIDRNAIDYFLKMSANYGRMSGLTVTNSTEIVLDNLDLLTPAGALKNAAVLLFGKRPSRFFSGIDFRICRLGNSESDIIVQDMVSGNLIEMADRVVDILKAKYLYSPIHYQGLQRIEPLEIPEASLREAIFNAIIHKDYMRGVDIQMKVYADSLWLWNNGNLPEDYTIETLLAPHSSRPRNPKLANAFFRAGFIESWGRGIEKIRNAGKEKGMSMPSIQAEMGGLSVRFFRAGLPQTIETNGTSGATLQPYNPTTLQPYNLTSLMQEIADYCQEWHSVAEIAEHVKRSRQYIRGEVIPKMSDVLERKYEAVNHPNQQYRTKHLP